MSIEQRSSPFVVSLSDHERMFQIVNTATVDQWLPCLRKSKESIIEAFEERAGILEDSGMSPVDAASQAALMAGITPDFRKVRT